MSVCFDFYLFYKSRWMTCSETQHKTSQILLQNIQNSIRSKVDIFSLFFIHKSEKPLLTKYVLANIFKNDCMKCQFAKHMHAESCSGNANANISVGNARKQCQTIGRKLSVSICSPAWCLHWKEGRRGALGLTRCVSVSVMQILAGRAHFKRRNRSETDNGSAGWRAGIAEKWKCVEIKTFSQEDSQDLNCHMTWRVEKNKTYLFITYYIGKINFYQRLCLMVHLSSYDFETLNFFWVDCSSPFGLSGRIECFLSRREGPSVCVLKESNYCTHAHTHTHTYTPSLTIAQIFVVAKYKEGRRRGGGGGEGSRRGWLPYTTQFSIAHTHTLSQTHTHTQADTYTSRTHLFPISAPLPPPPRHPPPHCEPYKI